LLAAAGSTILPISAPSGTAYLDRFSICCNPGSLTPLCLSNVEAHSK